MAEMRPLMSQMQPTILKWIIRSKSPNDGEPGRDDNEGRPVTSGQIPGAARRWLQRSSAFQSQSRKRISDLPLSSSAVEMAQARASCPSPLCVFAPLRLCVETAAIKTQRRKDAKVAIHQTDSRLPPNIYV